MQSRGVLRQLQRPVVAVPKRARGGDTVVATARPPARRSPRIDAHLLDRQRLEQLLPLESPPAAHPIIPGELVVVLEELEVIGSPARVEVEAHSSSHLRDQSTSSSGSSSEPSTSGLDATAGASEPLPSLAIRLGVLWQQLEARLNISARTKGLIMLNGLVLLLATNWVVVKEAGASSDPFGFAFLRFFVAALAFSPFLKTAFQDRRILQAGAEVGVYTAAGYMLQSMGLFTTDASRASFLSTFTVLVVPFLVGLTPGRSVRPITWGASLAALAGVSLLEQSGTQPSLGDLWSFLSAVAFGFQVFRTEHWARVLGNKASLPLMSVVLATTMVISGLAAVVANPSAVAAVLEHPVATEHLLMSGSLPWLSVAYTGLVTTDLALLMELMALHDVPSTDAAIIYSLEPLLGASLAWVLLGERWGTAGWFGAALIMASSLVTQVFGQDEDTPQLAAADHKED